MELVEILNIFNQNNSKDSEGRSFQESSIVTKSRFGIAQSPLVLQSYFSEFFDILLILLNCILKER